MISRRDFLKGSIGSAAAYGLIATISKTEELKGAEGFAELVIEACMRNKRIFPIDPLFEIIKIKIESNFNENAISPVGAVGLEQFMPETARMYGMNVYDGRYYEMMNLRTRLIGLNVSIERRKWNNNIINLSFDDFQRLQKDILSSQILEKKVNEVFEEHKEDLLNNRALDDRFNSEISINNAVHYLACLARDCKKHFGGPYEHIIENALASYNAGFGNVIKSGGVPFNFETHNYVRKVKRIYDKLYDLV